MYYTILDSTDIAKCSNGAGICLPRLAFLENQERAVRSPRLDFCSTFYQVNDPDFTSGKKCEKSYFKVFKSSG
jgi:hypothetical protein